MRTFVFAAAIAAIASPVFASDLNGSVVDQSGAPVPRAFVRLVDASRPAGPGASTFTDELGRFTLPSPSASCRVEATQSGFAPGSAACGDQPIRIVLRVAPIEEAVVVTATRTAAPADQVGASITAFTSQDLGRRDATLVSDLLRSAPGAMLIQSGGPGSVTSLFVRGGESSYNKVLLDGIPLNEPGGTFNFSNVTTDGLERVEIVRGAESALFGSDAMSSVVQLFTKRGARRERPEVSLSVEGGTYDTRREGGSVAGASGALDYALGLSRYDTDNRDPNSAFGNTTISANVGLTLGAGAILRAIGRGEIERAGTPGQTAFGRPDLDAFFTRHDAVGGVSFDQQVTPMFRQRAVYSLTASNQRSADLIVDPPYTPQLVDATLCPPPSHVCAAPFAFSDFPFDSRTDLRRHHASYQADWHLTSDAGRIGDHQLTVIGDWDGERATLTDALAGTSTPASRNNAGVSIQHQALWTRLFVTAGARFEHNASFGDAAVPRASVAYVLHEPSTDSALGSTTVRASAGLGIKEPTVLQSFSPSPYFHGNPDLQPERSRTAEIGLEQRFARDRAKVDVAWFDNRYRSLIALQTTDPDTFAAEYFNIGLSTARGVEISADAAPVRALRLRGGYTFLSSEIIDSISSFSPVYAPGQSLLRRPRHSGYVGVAATWKRLTADVDGVMIGSFADSDFSSFSPPILSNPGWMTWNARVAAPVVRQVTATLAFDNIADRQYMEPLGYRALGRAVRAGMRVGF
ncbi:MAG TPA: TonB-dependent receptor [Vicinamibacterales bacterium]|nr:TonB-dependent receptor [Vicinamibacterales bacterium]